MKKLYISLLAAAAIGFAGCADEEESVFSSSAAKRLEQSRNEYKDVLTADGGLWAIEYFTNPDEPGYVMTMKFSANGAVEISADHTWIGNTFTQETSLWDIISDNGTVLTFNTYNTVFHIFSTPENIVGPDAPKNEDSGADINELGYGHEGDYEFLLMSHDANGNLRMVGKKHGMTAWLRKLPADTDPEQFLAEIRAKRVVFSSKFPEFLMTEPSGATYVVTGLGSGIPTVYPRDFNGVTADPITQTVKANGILTSKGFRFREPLVVKRADDSTWELDELTWQEDGSLASASGVRITANPPGLNLSNSRLIWGLDKESMSDALRVAHDAASAALQAAAGDKFDLREVTLGYNALNGKSTLSYTIKAGTRLCRDFLTMTVADDGDIVTLEIIDANKASLEFNESAPAYLTFKQLITGEFAVRNIDAMNPTVIVFTSKTNPEISFSLNVQ